MIKRLSQFGLMATGFVGVIVAINGVQSNRSDFVFGLLAAALAFGIALATEVWGPRGD